MAKLKTNQLARLVHAEVQTQLKRYATARTREAFINHLVDVLSPALGHCYRYTLGIINHRTDQIEKWQRQEEGFLEQFADRLIEPTKAKGLDRKKAVEQALKEMMQTDQMRRRKESVTFQKTYKLATLVPLPENAHENFFTRVGDIVQVIFPS